MNSHRPNTIRTIFTILLLPAVLLAACSAATTAGSASPAIQVIPPSIAVTLPSVAPSEVPSASAVASEEPSPAPSGAVVGETPVPTTIDPCKLVTPAELSTLTGSTLGPPHASTTDSHTKLCSYGQEGLIFQVLVAVLPDAATAKKGEPAFKKDLETAASQAGISDLKLTELQDFEPGVDAAILRGSMSGAGQKVSAVSFYALKGAVLVALSDIALGGSVPTAGEMEAQGKATLARLP